MSETWFFHMDGNTVKLRSRVEGEDVIGDAFDDCAPGQSWLGVPYNDFARKDAGKVTVTNNVARIEPMTVPVDHNPFAGD